MDRPYTEIKNHLKSDCEKCSGLCCIALFCAKAAGFPSDKKAGVPCRYLMQDFRCEIHESLEKRKLRGCMTYDCLGAGQKVTQHHRMEGGRKLKEAVTETVCREFQLMFQLHEIEWYLLEARLISRDKQLIRETEVLISENERITSLDSESFLHMDILVYQQQAKKLLKRILRQLPLKPCKKPDKDYFGHSFHGTLLDHYDLSMALLIAADLEGCSAQGTVFLGADLRDANIRNADFSGSLFLTQMQINSARGNKNTKLPPGLSRPENWPVI